jgi:hypothetical protein
MTGHKKRVGEQKKSGSEPGDQRLISSGRDSRSGIDAYFRSAP